MAFSENKTLAKTAAQLRVTQPTVTRGMQKLEAELNASLDGVTDLTLDLEQLLYLSSAGLRVILSAQKRMNKQGHMTVTHVCADIMEVFEITGFVDILDIK